MYTKQPKKLLIMNILDILRKYSDADHRLSQKDIIDILQTEYGMTADRKSIRRNLLDLIDFGYTLEYSESIRRSKSGKEETVLTDWYLERDFSDAELRLLIDSLLFSKHIPYSHCKELIQKLEGFSSRYFKSKVRHICNLPEDQPQNTELFYTIEILDEAIERGNQVLFHYGDYGTDKHMHLRKSSDGEARNYLVNPYQMVATNGKYYLVGNYDKYDNISHYRIDHIRDIQLVDHPVKSQKKVKGFEQGLNLPKHMAEHIYMFSGESEVVTFRLKKYLLNDVMDFFGSEISFFDEAEDSISARVKVNRSAMQKWALQYALHAQILSPVSLVEAVKNDLIKACGLYSN